MDILQTIAGPEGSRAVDQLAAQFGLRPEQAQAAVAALVPALAAGLQRNTATEPGLSGLVSALGRGRHDAYLEDPTTLAQPTTIEDGNAVLGHVFGNKDVSRQVAARASEQTGIDPAILKRMLPLVAALVMGGLSRQTKARGGAAGGAGLTAVLGSLLDRNRDGSMVDDVVGMLGGFLGGQRRG
ncbi:hypothetical protein BH24GEM3_BH24GEM3_15300 [soil metagenome]|jgi:hypothetical protein|nr:DUF937 domain-containing protein [Gemmatimonadota bacterium]MDQ3607088.1 DUF937 domain-containing protein [Gemmatimonadota bacterium]